MKPGDLVLVKTVHKRHRIGVITGRYNSCQNIFLVRHFTLSGDYPRSYAVGELELLSEGK